MGEVILTLKDSTPLPLDLEQVSPDVIAGKTIEDIKALPVWVGNQKSNLGEVFKIEGEPSPTPTDLTITINGDLPHARKIGSKMTAGRIVVNGEVGFYLGDEMKGGSISVKGDAGAWVGVGMKGGLIEVEGNAGDFLGGSYRGTRSGMKGGVIMVKGNAGVEAGGWLKGGAIKIRGDAGPMPGIHMMDGSILIGGSCPGRVGASMTGGKIVLLGRTGDVLTGFQIEELKSDTKVEGEKVQGPFYSFSGDFAEAGRGKLFIHIERNPHLASYKEYLP